MGLIVLFIVLLLLSIIIRSLYLLYGHPSPQFLAPNSPPAHPSGSPTTPTSATNVAPSSRYIRDMDPCCVSPQTTLILPLCTLKFDVGGHSTIFSTLTLPERASRAKAVAPLFSTASIRNSQERLLEVVDDFVDRLRQGAQSGRPVNVLGLARAMARCCECNAEVMSASPFVDAYVGVGAFFNFAYGRVGESLISLVGYLTQSTGTAKSFTAIDDYTSRLSRLLERVSLRQTQIEIKDVCFAGTDSTGMNVATIIWYLAKYPEIQPPDGDPLSTPYLRAVIREGLRLSWANPIRLPRSVPAGGWEYKSCFSPAGTSVGVSAWQLHQEESVFPNSLSFDPERWLESNVTDDMLNNFFAFGKGTRALTLAIWKVVENDMLRGARILQWFNSRVKGEEILVQWIDR
ncbi:cytochrome P450 [Aspergillus foveolatus]|uniref:cytochrome P450 n=1 Tax=Aspergillus foveolatus TaxID=210207 RepID=UPI003CCDE68B